jgi:hypothetical protein
MPEFILMSIQEAQLRTIPGRQGTFMSEYADYIQQLPTGQAGRLRLGESEKHLTVRRRLISAAQAMNIPLIIKRSGNDLYFWRENGGEEQPRRKRSYTRGSQTSRRMRSHDEITAPDQPVDELGMVEQGISEEESPELGQTPV